METILFQVVRKLSAKTRIVHGQVNLDSSFQENDNDKKMKINNDNEKK